MNKFLRYSFMILLTLMSTSLLAEEVKFVPAETKPTATQKEISKDGITLTVTDGTMNRDDNYRTNKGQTLTVKSTVGNITKIEFISTVENPAENYGAAYQVNVGAFQAAGAKGTWTGDAAEVQLTAADHQVRATEYIITYTPNGNSPSEGGGDAAAGEPKGTGTLADPFNAVAANNFVSTLEADKATEQDYYVKGKIVEITDKNQFNTQYGNATFYISDDGSNNNTFYVYRTLYLENVKYTSGTLPKAGDEVIICGKLVNYRGNTPETQQNQTYIYSLNGKTKADSDTPVDPSEPKNVSVAEALDIIHALEAGQYTSEEYLVKGKVKSIEEISTNYGNATFDLEDGGAVLKVFRAKGFNNEKIADEQIIKVDDEVVVRGKLQKYVKDDVVTPELSSCYLISINGQTASVNSLEVEEANGPVYSLSGQRVEKPSKGLYIRNGRKFIVK